MANPALTASNAARDLASLKRGERGVVLAVIGDDSLGFGNPKSATIAQRLQEIGFVPGETVEVVATAWPGNNPIAVRVGTAVFALRKREAQAVLLT